MIRKYDFYDWECSCLICSWVLTKILKAKGYNARLAIGYYDTYYGHAYVIVGTKIVDITATQFGKPGVRVIDLSGREGSLYKAVFIEQKARRWMRNWPGYQSPKTYKAELNKVYRNVMQRI